MAEAPAPVPSDVIERIVWEYARAKIQQVDIINYNGANMALNHGRDIEKKLGLASQVSPYPSPQATSITLHQSQPGPAEQKPSVLKTVLLAGALLLGGVAAGAGAAYLLAHAQDRDYEVRFYDAQGNPISVPRKAP